MNIVEKDKNPFSGHPTFPDIDVEATLTRLEHRLTDKSPDDDSEIYGVVVDTSKTRDESIKKYRKEKTPVSIFGTIMNSELRFNIGFVFVLSLILFGLLSVTNDWLNFSSILLVYVPLVLCVFIYFVIKDIKNVFGFEKRVERFKKELDIVINGNYWLTLKQYLSDTVEWTKKEGERYRKLNLAYEKYKAGIKAVHMSKYLTDEDTRRTEETLKKFNENLECSKEIYREFIHSALYFDKQKIDYEATKSLINYQRDLDKAKKQHETLESIHARIHSVKQYRDNAFSLEEEGILLELEAIKEVREELNKLKAQLYK